MDLPSMHEACYPQVHPTTMVAVVRVESGGNPLALGVNKLVGPRPGPATSVEDAARIARLYIAQGYSVDIGLGQINSRNLPGLGLSIEQVLEPCTNLRAAALILADCYTRAIAALGAEGQPALQRGLACYNAGPVNFQVAFNSGYVAKYVPALRAGAPTIQAALTRPTPPPAAPRAPSTWGGIMDRGWGQMASIAP